MGNKLGFAKKVIAGASVAALMATLAPTTFAAFSDVSASEWYSDYVTDLVEMGVVSGYEDGTFKPNNPINRAEMAKIAVKVAVMSDVIADENDLADAPAYSDVATDQWYFGYVSSASKAKIFEGYRDGNGNLTGMFGPGNLVNRAEASKILLLSAGVKAMLTPASPFTDVNPSDWFYQYVTSAYNWSIIDGYKDANNNLTGKFGPGDAVTRAQIAKIAVLSQNPVDRINGNTNSSNENMSNENSANENSDVISNASFEAAVASSSPAATTLATGTAYNTVLKVTLTAGDEEDVMVKGLTLNHRGISTNSVVDGVLVVDMDGKRHGNVVSFSDNVAFIDLAGNPIMVEAGTSHTISIQVNFENLPGFTSGTFRVEIPANGIMATGSDTKGKVTVNGTYPISGAEHSLVAGSNIADVVVDEVVIAATRNVDLGSMGEELAKFEIKQNNGNEDIAIYEMTLHNNGNASAGDFTNLHLMALTTGKYMDGSDVMLDDTLAMGMMDMEGNYVFDFSANPIIIEDGRSAQFVVKGDIEDGSTRDIQLTLDDDYDLKVRGVTSGAFILPTAGSRDNSFPIGDTTNKVVINEGTLTVAKSPSSPSGDISQGGNDVVIASFKVEAAGEAIEIQGANLDIATSTGNASLLSSTIRLENGSGATIHSFNANAANASMFNGAFDGSDAISRFNNYYTIQPGEENAGLINVVVSIDDGAAEGSTLLASISDLRIKKISSNRTSTISQGALVTGNQMNITAANLIAAKNTSVGNENIVKGATNQRIGSFTLTTTNSEAVNVNSVSLNIDTPANVTNLKLMSGGVQLDNTKATAAATGNSFSTSGKLSIAKSSSVVVDVYADISTGFTAGSLKVTLPVNGVSFTGVTSQNAFTAPTAATDLQINPVVDNGTVSVNFRSQQTRAVAAAGETIDALSFEVKASNREDMRFDRAVIAFPASASSVSMVELHGADGKIAGPLSVTNGTADFSALNYTIEKNKTAVFTVKAMLTSSSSFDSDTTLVGALHYYEVTGKASGLKTVRRAGATVVGNPAYTQTYAANDLVYAVNTGLGLATTAGAAPSVTGTASTGAVTGTVGRMVTTAVESIVTGETTQVKAGQVAYFEDGGAAAGLRVISGAARGTTVSALGAQMNTTGGVVTANGDKLALLPTITSASDVRTGQLAVAADATLSFVAADNAFPAADAGVLPMVSTMTLTGAGSTAFTTTSGYMVGDLVAYAMDTANAPTLGVVTATTSSTITVDGAVFTVGAGGTGRITKLFTGAGQGKAKILENVYPVVAPQAMSTLTLTANSAVAKFDVTAMGTEELDLNQFVFNASGSFNGSVSDYKLYQLVGGNENELTATVNATGGGAGAHTVTVALAAPFTVQPGSTSTFLLKANTSAAKNAGTDSASLSYQLAGQAGERDSTNAITYSYSDSSTSPVTYTGLNVANGYSFTVGAHNF